MSRKVLRNATIVILFSTQCALHAPRLLAQSTVRRDTSARAAAENPILLLPQAPDEKIIQSTLPAPQSEAGFAQEIVPTTPLASDIQIPLPEETITGKPPAKSAVTLQSAARGKLESLREIARRKKLSLPLKNARVVVWKSRRRLELFDGAQLVKTYRVALGARPVGHKQRQGDSRTPEGQFFICTRNASTSAFHIFLGLSYPALPDATRGVTNKAITQREYQIIRQRLASRSAPLWRTRLGGWVGIHGGSDAGFAQRKMRERGASDWTAGCIALTNAEIREIYAATKMGTPVLIKP